MDEVPILGQPDPSAGHHGELVDPNEEVERFRASREPEPEEDEEHLEEPDPEDWHKIAREEDWLPADIEAKRNQITGEVTAKLREVAMKKLAIGGLGPEMVLRLLIRRVFIGTRAMYPPDWDEEIPDREPVQECELFLLYVAGEQLSMLRRADPEIRKAELSTPMVAGPGGLLVPGNREERRRELKDKRRSERKR